MESVKTYLLSVTGAAVLCGLLRMLLPKEGGSAAIGKMMAGIFLALTVLAPVGKLSLGKIEDFTHGFSREADAYIENGKQETELALRKVIKEKTEAYILDKAASLQLSLTADVRLSSDDIPVPVSVTLQGSAAPYAKARLEAVIEQDLGISKEAQRWI